MIKVAVAGATGYTGSELLRILLNHPKVEIVRITSEQSAGAALAGVFPQFKGLLELTYEPLDPVSVVQGVDIVFLALPHTESMKVTPRMVESDVRVIDLSADFRLKQPAHYRRWYHVEHPASALLATSVYGLPELHRQAVIGAKLLANPGCYPTAAILALAPLVQDRRIELTGVVIDAKSGVTGAGKTPQPHLHFPEANESLMAYRVGAHQHTPEIEQELGLLAGTELYVNFTPHLIPMNRGVYCTAYAALREPASTAALLELYGVFYKAKPFIRVLPADVYPSTRHVRGTNYCDIGLKVDERTGRVIVLSAVDNLVKGAAGQAVQNMNLMMGLEEETGLRLPSLVP